MGLRRVLAATAVVLVAAGCTSDKSDKNATGTTTSTGSATSSTSVRPLVQSLPDGCNADQPLAGQTVTFVKDGRAWAVDPIAGTLTCLFTVDDPGLFEWGPQADRIVLGGLAVRGVGSNAQRPSINTKPTWFSWSRPKGVALVFTAGARTALKRADIGSANVADLTPIQGATYGDIAYHPSGLAIAFVAKLPNKTGIWMSGNHGENPKELVSSTEGTEFGPIVFSHDGVTLYYGAHKKTGEYQVFGYDLTTAQVGGQFDVGGPIAGITEGDGHNLAVTTGTCATRRSVVQIAGGGSITLLEGDTEERASVLGSLPTGQLAIARGPCDAKRDLLLAQTRGEPRLLVKDVDRASVRVAEVSPAPPLPRQLPRSAVG